MRLWELFTPAAHLNELFDKPLEWKWRRQDTKAWVGSFSIDNDIIELNIGPGNGHLAGVAFFSHNGLFDVTNAGQSFPIFSTVIAMIREFINTVKPQGLEFSSKESSRTKLYSRFANELAKAYNWEVRTKPLDGGHIKFIIAPKTDGNLKEDGKIIPNVNTTCDVKPGEIERQAAKFGNKLDAKGRPPLLSGSYGDDSARFSANQGDPFYGSDGTRLPKNPKWS